MPDNDDDVYTIEADIPETQTYEAYLSSYRAYTGPQHGISGVPLGTLQSKNSTLPHQHTDNTPKTSEYSDSFIQYRPTSHMTLAALSAFLCFCPVGIASLVYACRARSAKKDGEFGQAATLGKSARDLAIASIVLGLAMLIFIVLIVVLVFYPQLTTG